MPDIHGKKPEEIAEYQKMIEAAQKALRTMNTSPLNRENFDKAIVDLESACKEMNNPPKKDDLLFDWPNHLKNLAKGGLYVDVIPQLQKELSDAFDNLSAMKEIRKNSLKRMFQK